MKGNLALIELADGFADVRQAEDGAHIVRHEPWLIVDDDHSRGMIEGSRVLPGLFTLADPSGNKAPFAIARFVGRIVPKAVARGWFRGRQIRGLRQVGRWGIKRADVGKQDI